MQKGASVPIISIRDLVGVRVDPSAMPHRIYDSGYTVGSTYKPCRPFLTWITLTKLVAINTVSRFVPAISTKWELPYDEN